MVRNFLMAAAFVALPFCGGAAQAEENGEQTAAAAVLAAGTASFYSTEMQGRRTANGEKCDPDELTAAHRTLPFGSKVRVTYPATGRSVIVRINDRGPFSRNRVLDLSRAAAREIGLERAGSGKVELALLD